MQSFEHRLHAATTSPLRRLYQALWRQHALNPTCPASPDLSGMRAVVTGGSSGIGFEVGCGLAERGATVLGTGTNETSIARAKSELSRRFIRGHFDFRQLSLDDLASVDRCVAEIGATAQGKPIDILVLNAGVWPQDYAASAQGFEIAFATNLLGHFALLTNMIERELLAASARVVVVTGDIYILAKDCTPDYHYAGRIGGTLAYCRSKLGNLWLADELQRRHAHLQVVKVHPGVVATSLVRAGGRIGTAFKRRLFISPRDGAQTVLLAATQPGYGQGVYLHNACGRMQLRAGDPALDTARAAALWQTMTSMVQGYRVAASTA